VLADWTDRWKAGLRRLERVVQPGTDPGNQAVPVPEDTPPNKAVLKLHLGLQKAESSVLVQARTARIGLAKFLLWWGSMATPVGTPDFGAIVLPVPRICVFS
jgi:hypothetical protein